MPFLAIVVARIRVSVSTDSSASCAKVPVGITMSAPVEIDLSTCSPVMIPRFTMSFKTSTPLSVLESSCASTYMFCTPARRACSCTTFLYTSGFFCAVLFWALLAINASMVCCSTVLRYSCFQSSFLIAAMARMPR